MESIILEATQNQKKYKCPYCDKRTDRQKLITHIDKYHEDMIPKDYTSTRLVFNVVNKKDHGTCIICREESPWNEDKARYDRICTKKSCKEKYIEITANRLYNKTGKTKQDMLNDPEFQKKMLANRKISGEYKFSDGSIKTYTGSYEKSFLEFMDKYFHVKSEDLITPGPSIKYEYEGKSHTWITDAYYEPYNLVFDIKDGGDNPNNRPMKEYREKQISKEKAIKKLGKFNYIRLTDNNMGQLIEIMLDIKEQLKEYDNKLDKPIIRINEDCSTTIGAIPNCNDHNVYIVNYTKKNQFNNDEEDEEIYTGICRDYMSDLHLYDEKDNKFKLTTLEDFKKIYKEVRVFKYLEEINFNEYIEKCNSEKRINYFKEEAEYSKKNKYPVFIVLMHSGTPMANVIKAVTKDEYSHACISFNSNLDPLYSFGNKKLNSLDPGFVINSPSHPFFIKRTASYSTYVMYVDEITLNKMKNKLQFFIDNKDTLKYDLVNLVSCALNKESEKSEKYFCSRFVMTVLGAGMELDKVPSLWKPMDISTLENISLVNKGDNFRKYDYKITEKNLKRIQQKKFNNIVFEQTMINRYITLNESLFEEVVPFVKELEIIKEIMTYTIKRNLHECDINVPPFPLIPLNEDASSNINYYRDLNGIYVENVDTHIRSKSYFDIQEVPNTVIKIISDGKL